MGLFDYFNPLSFRVGGGRVEPVRTCVVPQARVDVGCSSSDGRCVACGTQPHLAPKRLQESSLPYIFLKRIFYFAYLFT